VALLIGVTLASTFFAGIDIKANHTAKQAIDQQLRRIYYDMAADISSSNVTNIFAGENIVSKIGGAADVEVLSTGSNIARPLNESQQNYLVPARLCGIRNDSHVYAGWLNKPAEGMGENETYVYEHSPLASRVKPGDTIQMNLSQGISLKLTVKGLAQLNEEALSIAKAEIYPYWVESFGGSQADLLIVDWQKTALKSLKLLQTSIMIYLDRESLIAPWDVDSSISRIRTIQNQIENELATIGLNTAVSNNLESTLASFRFTSMTIRFAFTFVSLPVFFMAWYMGTTVSKVSYNQRRHEIGLLLTKGFSKRQVLEVFFIETLMIGLFGGLLGVLFGFLLNPFFTQFDAASPLNPHVVSEYTLTLTVAFGIIIAFFSTYSSARKAAQLSTTEALREYLPMEEEKPHRKKWIWAAFILGAYKLAVYILGINVTAEMTNIIFRSGNFVVFLLVGLFMFVDLTLTFIGPLLFFWGFTKLFIQSSLKFQELTARAARFAGDLSVLATRNVRRNPARYAELAFLIALIVGYSVQVTGQFASESDFAVRQIRSQVGADVAVQLGYASGASQILRNIVANISQAVHNATIDYSFYAYSTSGANLRIVAVDPQAWPKSAFYENEWFSGNDVTSAFDSLSKANDTIILERGIAKAYKLNIGDSIALSSGLSHVSLKVVGFFGPELTSAQEQAIVDYRSSQFWSIVPEGFLSSFNSPTSVYTRILIKLKADANGTQVANSIRNLNESDIVLVDSFDEKWKTAQSDVITMNTLDVQRLGIIFAVLSASVGTALVSVVSMKERGREATIMSVKGLSYKQLVVMFLTENLALVTFAVVLGLGVGLIVLRGNVSAATSNIVELVQRRIIFPLDMSLLLVSCVGLIFFSTILPILLMSRKYVTKLERMVRLR